MCYMLKTSTTGKSSKKVNFFKHYDIHRSKHKLYIWKFLEIDYISINIQL